MAEYAEDSTVIVEVVVVEMEQAGHVFRAGNTNWD
jgi:hypothetical protein